MGLKCIVIDSENKDIGTIVRHISEMPSLQLHQIYNDAQLALVTICTEDEIQFIFCDIEIVNHSSAELIRSLRDKTRFLILTTRHKIDVVMAYDLNVTHYLLKPVSYVKFAIALDSILKNFYLEKKISQNKILPPMFVRGSHKGTFNAINPKDIIAIEASKHDISIITANSQYLTHIDLGKMEIFLDSEDFIRISKSYIVAKSAITMVNGNKIQLNNGNEYVVGDTFRPLFNKFLQERMYCL